MSINNDEFKAALGRFTTGVTVVTTFHNNKFYGLTANSVTSLSLNPSLILFNIDNNSSNLEYFLNSSFYGVSILSAKQKDLACNFAKKDFDKFKDVNFSINKNNIPILPDAIANLTGKKHDIFPCGDHHIFVMEVENIQINHEQKPLIYYNKEFYEGIK